MYVCLNNCIVVCIMYMCVIVYYVYILVVVVVVVVPFHREVISKPLVFK